MMGVALPSGWTSANLTIEVSFNNSDWIGLVYNSASPSSQINVVDTPVPSAFHSVDATGTISFRYVRVRSGTTAAPVNQVSERAVSLMMI